AAAPGRGRLAGRSSRLLAAARAGFGPRRVNAPPETPAPILAPEIAPAAAVPGTNYWECRQAGAAARRRKWIGPRPVPPQAFRRAWPKERRYGAWNLTRDRVSARDRVAPVNMPNAANPGISEPGAGCVAECLTFPASRPCSRRSPWGG